MVCSEDSSLKIKGPVASAYEIFKYYCLHDKLKQCIKDKNFDNLSVVKSLIKRVVKNNETARWKASCMLYRRLSLYQVYTVGIGMHAWWKVSMRFPFLCHKISLIMSLCVGTQPKGLQRNLGSNKRQLCGQPEIDDCRLVLFICSELDTV